MDALKGCLSINMLDYRVVAPRHMDTCYSALIAACVGPQIHSCCPVDAVFIAESLASMSLDSAPSLAAACNH